MTLVRVLKEKSPHILEVKLSVGQAFGALEVHTSYTRYVPYTVLSENERILTVTSLTVIENKLLRWRTWRGTIEKPRCLTELPKFWVE